MNSEDKLMNEIFELVARERGTNKKSLNAGLRLSEDLGMDGDDAVEFFTEYSKTFQVDLTEMRWNYHFGPEGFFPLWWLLRILWIKKWIPIRIQDLIDSAKEGKWIFDYSKYKIS